MSYPPEIRLERGSEELKFLTKHSQLLETYTELSNGDVILSAADLFQGDETKWKMFVDVFFPELAIQRFFVFKNGKMSVDPKRGTEEDLRELLDYLLVEEPRTMMNFAEKQARKSLNKNVYANTVARGVAPRATASAAVAVERNYGNWVNNNNYFNNNLNNNNNENVEIGYTEEEEEFMGKLKGKNVKKYYTNGGKRKTRKLKRSKKSRKGKSRKH